MACVEGKREDICAATKTLPSIFLVALGVSELKRRDKEMVLAAEGEFGGHCQAGGRCSWFAWTRLDRVKRDPRAVTVTGHTHHRLELLRSGDFLQHLDIVYQLF